MSIEFKQKPKKQQTNKQKQIKQKHKTKTKTKNVHACSIVISVFNECIYCLLFYLYSIEDTFSYCQDAYSTFKFEPTVT